MRSYKALLGMAIVGKDSRWWYHNANRAVVRLAEHMGRDARDVAAAIAVASIRTQVSRHVPIAIDLLNGNRNAIGIMAMHWELWDRWQSTGTLANPDMAVAKRSDKVCHFLSALNGTADAIPIDVWMMRAADISRHQAESSATRERLRGRIRQVATTLGWQPRMVQAAIWQTARDAANVKEKGIV